MTALRDCTNDTKTVGICSGNNCFSAWAGDPPALQPIASTQTALPAEQGHGFKQVEMRFGYVKWH